MKITWIGHSSFKISGSSVIYIDPWKVKGNAPADIILLTHPHFDHFSPKDVSKIQRENTLVLGPVESIHDLKGNIKTVLPGKSVKEAGVTIEAFPAYNTDKNFHPKVNKWLSYLISMDGVKVFHTGDSDLIPEHKKIRADILLVPVSGTYVMTAEEAAGLANEISPQIAVPMHWGDIVGSEENAVAFSRLAKCSTKILKPGDSFEFNPA